METGRTYFKKLFQSICGNWHRTYCDMKSKSTSSASIKSTNGKASMPERPGWMPQSSMIFLPLNSSIIHDRPTSWPAPLFSEKYRKQIQWKHNLKQIWFWFLSYTYSGRINRISLSSSGISASLLRFVAIWFIFRFLSDCFCLIFFLFSCQNVLLLFTTRFRLNKIRLTFAVLPLADEFTVFFWFDISPSSILSSIRFCIPILP